MKKFFTGSRLPRGRRGFIMVSVVLLLLFLVVIVPVMVSWIQQDSRIAIKDQKSSLAFSLAEAAVDRGYWKVKGSTTTFGLVMAGGTLAGYNFDTVYNDITGGSYRIKVASGPDTDQLTVIGEGRDSLGRETRAIKAIYLNTTVPGAIVAAGNYSQTSGSVVHWGPVMAQGDITVAGSIHFPRKLSRQTVKPLDPTNDTNPPNTDSKEWWSNYNVPELPVFDFETMKASAAASGTLNCTDVANYSYVPSPLQCRIGSWGTKYNNTCTAGGVFQKGNASCTTGLTPGTCALTATSISVKCCHSATYGGTVTCDYDPATTPNQYTICYLPGDSRPTSSSGGDPIRHKDYTWFWDKTLTVGGNPYGLCSDPGIAIKGTIIVANKGDLTINGNDDYPYKSGRPVLDVPPMAWQEYQYSSSLDFPGKLTSTSNSATYTLGSDPTAEVGAMGADLGIWGFVYVDGDLTINNSGDVYGAIWANGSFNGADNASIFYNSKLKVPTLNVVLQKQSWKEVPGSTGSW